MRTFVIFFAIMMIPKGAVTTTWRQGGIEKVGWGILANHGGGYSYRLCRAGEQLTEECFQKTPLRYLDCSLLILTLLFLSSIIQPSGI